MSGYFRWYFSVTNKGEKRSYVGVTALLVALILCSILFAPWHKGEAHHVLFIGIAAWMSGYWFARWSWWRPE